MRSHLRHAIGVAGCHLGYRDRCTGRSRISGFLTEQANQRAER